MRKSLNYLHYLKTSINVYFQENHIECYSSVLLSSNSSHENMTLNVSTKENCQLLISVDFFFFFYFGTTGHRGSGWLLFSGDGRPVEPVHKTLLAGSDLLWLMAENYQPSLCKWPYKTIFLDVAEMPTSFPKIYSSVHAEISCCLQSQE